MLLVGSVAAADVPELGEPETRDEVRRRLAEAGCELVYSASSERWLARLDGPMPELEGHDPVLALGTAELAVLATCWLHLRFLPGVLERLAKAGYLTMREGRVEAGPLLDTLDEPGAAEQARALVARHQRLAHLRRRAAELDGGEDEGEQDDAKG